MFLKNLKYVILIVFILLVSLQVFWRMKYGNGEIYIQNQDLMSTYNAEVLLNGEVIGNYSFSSNNIISHQLSLGKKVGNQKIRILRKDNQYSVDAIVNTLLVRWVVISINDDKDIWIESSIIPPLLQ